MLHAPAETVAAIADLVANRSEPVPRPAPLAMPTAKPAPALAFATDLTGSDHAPALVASMQHALDALVGATLRESPEALTTPGYCVLERFLAAQGLKLPPSRADAVAARVAHLPTPEREVCYLRLRYGVEPSQFSVAVVGDVKFLAGATDIAALVKGAPPRLSLARWQLRACGHFLARLLDLDAEATAALAALIRYSTAGADRGPDFPLVAIAPGRAVPRSARAFQHMISKVR